MTPSVRVFELHDAALDVWDDAGVENRILVHIDAHHDMWWVDDHRSTTAANFLSPALTRGMFREIYWIVPDGTFRTATTRRALRRQITSMLRHRPARSRIVDADSVSVTATIQDRRLTICTLDALPKRLNDVVLDIDVDYLVIPQVAHNRADTHGDLPWRWPSELVTLIRNAEARVSLVTIAYSVEGCYTPLRWKYLGDELAARLTNRDDSTAIAGFERMGSAVAALQLGDTDRAEALYLEAARLLPGSAAPEHHLALLHLHRGDEQSAQWHSAKARQIDPSYSTGFATLGPHYFWQGRHAEALAEFQTALRLNPLDSHAAIGMAWIAAARSDWPGAIKWYERSLAACDESLDAHRGLGDARMEVREWDAAARHYERSLQLALHGHKPLSWHVRTSSGAGELIDEDHCIGYASLGRAHARRGAIDKAIACYRMAFAARSVGVRLRLQLASLLAGKKRWREAYRETASAAAQIPASARWHARRLLRAGS
jgi:tetratricopeptide repeat protein